MRRAVPDVAYTTMGRAKPSTLTGRTNYHWRFTPFREAREAGKDVAEAAEVAGIPVDSTGIRGGTQAAARRGAHA